MMALLFLLLAQTLDERLASDDIETYDAAVGELSRDKDKGLKTLLAVEKTADGKLRDRLAPLIERFADETAGHLLITPDRGRWAKIGLTSAAGKTTVLDVAKFNDRDVAYPMLSPDGKRIAFMAYLFDKTIAAGVCVVDVDGKNARRVSKGLQECWVTCYNLRTFVGGRACLH